MDVRPPVRHSGLTNFLCVGKTPGSKDVLEGFGRPWDALGSPETLCVRVYKDVYTDLYHFCTCMAAPFGAKSSKP